MGSHHSVAQDKTPFVDALPLACTDETAAVEFIEAMRKDGGVVEVDETYIGGHKTRRKQGWQLKNKATVIGMVERGGRLHPIHLERVTGANLKGAIRQYVDKSAMIITDDSNLYRGLKR